MPDELITQPATEVVEPAAPPPETPTEPVVPPPTATTDWQEELNKADPVYVRKIPRIAGIIGSEIQRAREEERRRIEHESNERAAREANEQLLQLAREDPVDFAEKYLSEYEKSRIQKQLDTVQVDARTRIATSIGQAYNNTPEWAELDDKDHARIAQSLVGKSDDEVIPIFTQVALELLAEKRAQKKHAEWKSKDLSREKEALKQEIAAQMLKASESPDTTPPKRAPAAFSPRAMTDQDFDTWWKSGKL